MYWELPSKRTSQRAIIIYRTYLNKKSLTFCLTVSVTQDTDLSKCILFLKNGPWRENE